MNVEVEPDSHAGYMCVGGREVQQPPLALCTHSIHHREVETHRAENLGLNGRAHAPTAPRPAPPQSMLPTLYRCDSI